MSMSGMPLPPPRQKVLTPALIGALVAVGTLAIITLIVVVRSPSSTSAATSSTSVGNTASASNSSAGVSASGSTAATSTSTSGTTSQGSSGDGPTLSASDSSFEFVVPEGFIDSIDSATDAEVIVQITSSIDTSDKSIILAVSNPANGRTLDEATDFVKTSLEDGGRTTAHDESTSGVTADGEEIRYFTTEPFTGSSGITIQNAAIVTIHDNTIYVFLVNSRPVNQARDNAALINFVESVAWTD